MLCETAAAFLINQPSINKGAKNHFMKKILIVCLLGMMGTLLPMKQSTAKELFKKQIRVNCNLEEDVMRAFSEQKDGPIMKMYIENSETQIVQIEYCGGSYTCESYIGDLPAGNYKVTVVTTNTSYTQAFYISE